MKRTYSLNITVESDLSGAGEAHAVMQVVKNADFDEYGIGEVQVNGIQQVIDRASLEDVIAEG